MDGPLLRHPLRTTAIALGALAIAATAGPAAAAQPRSCGSAAATQARPVPRSDIAILCLINRERAINHLGPLRINPRLAGGARRYSRQMIADRDFSHIGPGNASLQRRVFATGYLLRARAYALGEALAWVGGPQATPTALVGMLMADPPHRAILLGAYRDIGIGVGVGVPKPGVPGATLTLDLGAVTR